MGMANFLANGAQCFLLAREFLPQKLLAAAYLLQDDCRTRPPGERQPGKKRSASLSNRSAENIETAGIVRLTSKAAELAIKLLRAAARKLLHAADAEQVKVREHGRPNRNQVSKLALANLHKPSWTETYGT